jgi:hypothetical protein
MLTNIRKKNDSKRKKKGKRRVQDFKEIDEAKEVNVSPVRKWIGGRF